MYQTTTIYLMFKSKSIDVASPMAFPGSLLSHTNQTLTIFFLKSAPQYLIFRDKWSLRQLKLSHCQIIKDFTDLTLLLERIQQECTFHSPARKTSNWWLPSKYQLDLIQNSLSWFFSLCYGFIIPMISFPIIIENL